MAYKAQNSKNRKTLEKSGEYFLGHPCFSAKPPRFSAKNSPLQEE
jgi:hypothetical protein